MSKHEKPAELPLAFHVLNKTRMPASRSGKHPSVFEALAYDHWPSDLICLVLAKQLVHKAESKFQRGTRTPAGDDVPINHHPSLSIAARKKELGQTTGLRLAFSVHSCTT